MTTSLGHTSVTSDDTVTVTVTSHRTQEKEVESFRKSNIIQYVHHMLTSYLIHGCLG